MREFKHGVDVNVRRKNTLERLENQLKQGTKRLRQDKVVDGKEEIPLTKEDKSRIEKEIKILKDRII